MVKWKSLLCLSMLGLAMQAPASAEDAAASGQTISLTERQKAAILDANSEAKVDRLLNGGVRDRSVHGEVGAFIGTHGAHGIFGTAAIPIGENGGAVIAFENSRYGRMR